MTIDDFYKILNDYQDNFDWIIVNNRLRGRNPLDIPYIFFCPITAICRRMTGRLYNNYEWEKAAEKLKMNISEAKQIMNGADHIHDECLVSMKLLQITQPTNPQKNEDLL